MMGKDHHGDPLRLRGVVEPVHDPRPQLRGYRLWLAPPWPTADSNIHYSITTSPFE